MSFYWKKLYDDAQRKNNGVAVPEARLYGGAFGGVIAPIGLLIVSFTSYNYLFWFGPQVGLCLLLIGIYQIFESVQAYLSDAYGSNAASAIAGQGFVRNALAASFVSRASLPLFPSIFFVLTFLPLSSRTHSRSSPLSSSPTSTYGAVGSFSPASSSSPSLSHSSSSATESRSARAPHTRRARLGLPTCLAQSLPLRPKRRAARTILSAGCPSRAPRPGYRRLSLLSSRTTRPSRRGMRRSGPSERRERCRKR